MKMLAAISLCILVGTATVWAGTDSIEGIKPSDASPQGIDFKNAQGAIRGLFDPTRLSMSHSLGMSFNSPAGNSQYYLNTMTYQFSPNLTAYAQVGVQRVLGGRNAFGSSGPGAQFVVPNLGFLYTPNPNLRIEFHMSQGPTYGYHRRYGRFYNPFNE